MTKLPKTMDEDLALWFQKQRELKILKYEESALRKRLFSHFFPKATEGTNKHDLPNEYVLKGVHKISRTVDPASFDAIKTQLRKKKLNPDELVKYKPELVLREYRKLTDVQRELFDQALIIKDGSPAMEVVAPVTAE